MKSSSASFSRFAAILHTVPAADNMSPRMATAISSPMYVNPPAARRRGRSPRDISSPCDIRRAVDGGARCAAVDIDDSRRIAVVRHGRYPRIRGFGERIHRDAANVAMLHQIGKGFGLVPQVGVVLVAAVA